MHLSMKNLDRICLVVMVAVLLMCGGWVVHFSITQQKQIRQENDLLSNKVKDVNLAETNLQRLKAVLDATKEEVRFLNERIPESAELGELLKHLDFLIKERSIALISLQPEPTEEERLYTKIPIRLMFKGSFVNIFRLLHDLETMNRMMVMEEITIVKSRSNEQCQVDLTASVFER